MIKLPLIRLIVAKGSIITLPTPRLLQRGSAVAALAGAAEGEVRGVRVVVPIDVALSGSSRAVLGLLSRLAERGVEGMQLV